MAKQIALEIELNGDKQVLRSMNDMNDAAEQLRMQMESATDPQDIRRFGRELQKVEGHVKDIDLQFESLDVEQRMTAATDVVAGLAGGFAAVEGAIAIAGVESEAFEETMTKVMGAMAFAQGIKDMGAAAVAMKKLTDVSKIQAAAQRVLNFVMSMNPIGLIVTAIGLLIAGIIALQKPIQNAIAKFESMNGIAKVLIGILAGPLLATIYAVTKALEFFGVINSKTQNDAISAAEKRRKAENAASRARIKELNNEIDKVNDQIELTKSQEKVVRKRYEREIELAKAAGKDVTQLEEDKLRALIESTRKQIRLLKDRYDYELKRAQEARALAERQTDDLQKVIQGNVADIAEFSVEANEKAQEQLTAQLEDFEHDLDVHLTTVERSRRDADEEQQKEQRDRYRDHLQKMRDIEIFYEDLKAENISDDYERELEQERLRYERLREQYKGHAEVLEQLEIQHQANLSRIKRDETKRRHDEIEDMNEVSAGIAAYQRQKRSEEDQRWEAENRKKVVQAANQDWRSEDERRAERDRKTRQQRLQFFAEDFENTVKVAEISAQALGNSLTAISDLIGKETEKGAKLAKAAAVIQVMIDTARALSAAIAGAVTAAAQTGPAMPFVVAGYIATGVASVLTAMAQVKGILSKANVQTPSLGSATAGATGGARINPVQSGNTQIDANGNSIQDTQEMKVHVVESEISEVQGRVSVIENQAAAR